MKKLDVHIGENFFARCASSSLSGKIVYDHGANALAEPANINLIFHEWSRAKVRENGGPNEWIMSEFTPRLFLENILDLQSRGHTISIELLRENV